MARRRVSPDASRKRELQLLWHHTLGCVLYATAPVDQPIAEAVPPPPQRASLTVSTHSACPEVRRQLAPRL